MAQTEATIVCVTGAQGYLALELVKACLVKGWTVRGTVQSKSEPAQSSTVAALAAALPGTLELFEADLTIDGSFDEAVKGSHYVFHVASPVPSPKHIDPERDLVQPAVQGTVSVLRAAAKSKATVRRIVLTSSGTAVMCDRMRTPPANGTGYTETDWVPADTWAAYPRSKVQAERAAWELAKQESLDLVTILPVLTLGPVISTAPTWSVDFMKVWLEGGAGNPYPFTVDIRDVVNAHIRAAELPAASGRYILSHPTSLNWRQAIGWLQERFPQYDFADVRCMSDDRVLDNSKATRELGIQLRPMRETILDMARCMYQLGIATPKLKA